jgi:hypothetical protein
MPAHFVREIMLQIGAHLWILIHSNEKNRYNIQWLERDDFNVDNESVKTFQPTWVLRKCLIDLIVRVD